VARREPAEVQRWRPVVLGPRTTPECRRRGPGPRGVCASPSKELREGVVHLGVELELGDRGREKPEERRTSGRCGWALEALQWPLGVSAHHVTSCGVAKADCGAPLSSDGLPHLGVLLPLLSWTLLKTAGGVLAILMGGACCIGMPGAISCGGWRCGGLLWCCWPLLLTGKPKTSAIDRSISPRSCCQGCCWLARGC
jgi:hypothetical protein